MTDLFRNNPAALFSRGFFYPFHALRFLLRHPRLLKYIVIPFLINTVVFTTSVYLGLDFFHDVVIELIPRGEAWYWIVLYYLLWLAAVLVTAVLVFFAFTVVGNLIASPFNDLLSERTEDLLAGHSAGEPFSLRLFFRDAGRTMAEEMKKLSLFVAGMILLLLLNLLPGFGQILYSAAAGLFTLFFLVVEYLGYVFSRKRVSFREQRRYIFSRTFLMLGFGLGVFCVLLIPLFQFFCIPLAVIGATLLWWEHQAGPSSVSTRSSDR